MKCPYSDEDMQNENFSEIYCRGCRHFEECKYSYLHDIVEASHPAFSASTRNKLQNKCPEFYDKKRFEKGKILQEDIIEFAFNLLASTPKEIWGEINEITY